MAGASGRTSGWSGGECLPCHCDVSDLLLPRQPGEPGQLMHCRWTPLLDAMGWRRSLHRRYRAGACLNGRARSISACDCLLLKKHLPRGVNSTIDTQDSGGCECVRLLHESIGPRANPGMIGGLLRLPGCGWSCRCPSRRHCLRPPTSPAPKANGWTRCPASGRTRPDRVAQRFEEACGRPLNKALVNRAGASKTDLGQGLPLATRKAGLTRRACAQTGQGRLSRQMDRPRRGLW